MSKPWETKEAEKVTPSAQPAHTEKASPTVLLSQADAYIHERIKSQPKTLSEVDVKIEETFDPNHHRLSLPRELDSYLKKYTFHWIYKNPRSISEACDIKGWVLVNRTHFDDLPNHLFSVTGSIERGDMILGFMKATRAEKYRSDVALKSSLAVKSRIGAHKGNPDFYVPSDKTEEGEKSSVIGL